MEIQQIHDVEVFQVKGGFFMVQPQTGMVAVMCGCHHELNGMHYWTHHGDTSIYHFLARLRDRHYVFQKLFSYNAIREYDEEATHNEIKRHIIEWRRDGSYDAEKARELWDELEGCDNPYDIHRLEIDDVWELIQMKFLDCTEWFWTDMWLPFVEFAKTKAAEFDAAQAAKEAERASLVVHVLPKESV